MASKKDTEREIRIVFSAEADADKLNAAMANLGTDEDTISELLTHRTNKQRQEIDAAYRIKYGKDLVDELKSELSGDFENVIIALMTDPIYYLAKEIRTSLKGPGTNEETLVEIVASLKNLEKNALKAAYEKLYDRSLVDDIDDDTSGYFRQFLIALLSDVRNDIDNPDEATEKLLTGDENDWGYVLSTNTYSSLQRIFKRFENRSSKSVQSAIEDQFSGDVELAFTAVAKIAVNTPQYFAERLRKSLKGGGTDEATIIRIIVSRSEIDLNKIQSEYQSFYERNLQDDIESDTHGPFEDTLVYLLKGIQV